jgi:hypothetical protein
MKKHKPIVVLSGFDSASSPPYCRVCGVPVDRTLARNGRMVSTHADTDDRYPVLGDDLKPVGVPVEPKPGRCTQHPAFDADYCPVCGTTTAIGDREIGGTR